MSIDPAWIALIGTLFGGVGLKVLENWLGKSKIKIDEASQIRDELRIQITNQTEEIRLLEAEVKKLTQDYYDLRDKYSELNTQYIIALDKLKTFSPKDVQEQKPPAIDPPVQ
jgi:archaellum component FlaC